MTTHIARRMSMLNGVAHIQDLLVVGFTRHQIAAMLHSGELIRPRIGWYVDPSLPGPAIRAVRVGGMLGCCSAAESYGLPVPQQAGLHVALEPNSSRLRSSTNASRHVPAGAEPGVHLHWRDRRVGHQRFRVGLVDALQQMVSCVGEEWSVAAIDAARMKTPGSEGHLDDAFYRMLVRFCAGASGDIAGLSVRGAESPLESIVRLRLQRMGLEPVIQLPIGKYRADIVIGDRLVIECDGTQHATAEQFVRDRDRDALFAARGYRMLRFTYAQVMQSWDSLVVPAILAALHGSGDLHGPGGFLHGSGRNGDFS